MNRPVTQNAYKNSRIDPVLNVMPKINRLGFQDIPGPPPTKILGPKGNLLRFFGDPIHYMESLHKEYGEVVSFVKGAPGIIFGFGPKYNQQILSNIDKFHTTGITVPGPEDSAQRRIGVGLLNMNGSEHKHYRQMLMPLFMKRVVEGYQVPVESYTEELLRGWKTGHVVEMTEAMKEFMLRVSCRLLFGMSDPDEGILIGRMTEKWMEMSTSVGVRLFNHNLPFTPYRRMLNFAESLENRIKNLADKRRKEGTKGNDLLTILLSARDEEGNPIPEKGIIGLLNFMFVASSETTAHSLDWTLFLLAQHPPILGELQEELKAVCHGAAPTQEKFKELPLLDGVIKESMRLLPPGVYNCRRAKEDFTFGDYDLPKGSTVAFSHYITHHMPEIFPEPNRFNPKRWETIAPSPYEYLPFSAGSRRCIGSEFALLTMKISLGMICQRFKFRVVPGSTIDRRVNITLSPKRGMPMEILSKDSTFKPSKIRGNIKEMVDLN